MSCSEKPTEPVDLPVYNIIYESQNYFQSTLRLMSINSDGTNKTTLVDSGFCRDPKISADGKTFVFVAGNPSDIFSYSIVDSSIVNLTSSNQSEVFPQFSPDGMKIAFLINNDMYIMDSDGNNKLSLCNNNDGSRQPQYSPDGKSIIYISGDDLWIVNNDGSDNKMLHESRTDEKHYPIMGPKYSPKGNRIYFEEMRVNPQSGQELQIFSIYNDGSDKAQLTSIGTNWGFSFNPSGDRIAFCSDRDGNNEIYIMNNDGINKINLTHSPNSDYNPVFSPDGGYISFLSKLSSISDIFIMDTSGGNKRNISNDDANKDRDQQFNPIKVK